MSERENNSARTVEVEGNSNYEEREHRDSYRRRFISSGISSESTRGNSDKAAESSPDSDNEDQGNSTKPRSLRLFIGQLNPRTTSESLRSYFNQFGTITECQVMFDRGTNHSRCFGFVAYTDYESVEKVMANSNGHTVDNKIIRVVEALPKSGPGSDALPPKKSALRQKEKSRDTNLKDRRATSGLATTTATSTNTNANGFKRDGRRTDISASGLPTTGNREFDTAHNDYNQTNNQEQIASNQEQINEANPATYPDSSIASSTLNAPIHTTSTTSTASSYNNSAFGGTDPFYQANQPFSDAFANYSSQNYAYVAYPDYSSFLTPANGFTDTYDSTQDYTSNPVHTGLQSNLEPVNNFPSYSNPQFDDTGGFAFGGFSDFNYNYVAPVATMSYASTVYQQSAPDNTAKTAGTSSGTSVNVDGANQPSYSAYASGSSTRQ